MTENFEVDKAGIKVASFSLAVFIIGLFIGVGVASFIGSSPTSKVIADSNTASAPSPQVQNQQSPTQPAIVINAGDLVDDDPSIGPVDAKIIIVEFADFQCPYCGAAAGKNQDAINYLKSRDPSWEPAIPKLKEFARQGKIKLVYRDFPLNGHENAQKAAEAGQCAYEQGKFWEMHDKIFENQGALDMADLKKYAGETGLNTGQFNACLDSGKYANEVKKDLSDGVKIGVSGTPTFIINDVVIGGAEPAARFLSLIEGK